jgi:hypothetical protein
MSCIISLRIKKNTTKLKKTTTKTVNYWLITGQFFEKHVFSDLLTTKYKLILYFSGKIFAVRISFEIWHFNVSSNFAFQLTKYIPFPSSAENALFQLFLNAMFILSRVIMISVINIKTARFRSIFSSFALLRFCLTEGFSRFETDTKLSYFQRL